MKNTQTRTDTTPAEDQKDGGSSFSIVICGAALSISGASISFSSKTTIGFAIGITVILIGSLCCAYGGFIYGLANNEDK